MSGTEGNIDASLIGGNASSKGPKGEGIKSTVTTDVDIVMNHHFQETSFTKEAYKKYINDHMKSIKGKRRTETRKSKTFYDRGCGTNQADPCEFQKRSVLYW